MTSFTVRQRSFYLSPHACQMAAILFLLTAGIMQVAILVTSDPLNRDFAQNWLMAKAFLKGIEPYQPVQQLQNIILGRQSEIPFSQISPHPPLLILLAFPFALLNLPVACGLWLSIGILCNLAASSVVIATLWPQASSAVVLLISALVLHSIPSGSDLYFGNWTSPITLLLILAWRATRLQDFRRGALYLGLAISVKISCLPFLLLLLLKRKVRASAASCALAAGLNLISCAILQLSPLTYLRVLQDTPGRYSSDIINLSLWTIGPKLFDGSKSAYVSNPAMLELVRFTYDPIVATVVTYFTILIAISFLFIWLKRCQTYDAQSAVLFLVLPFLSPLTWVHYLFGLLMPIAYVWHERMRSDRNNTQWQLLLLTTGTLWITFVGAHLLDYLVESVTTFSLANSLCALSYAYLAPWLARFLVFSHLIVMLFLWRELTRSVNVRPR